jgi:peroxiredoxin
MKTALESKIAKKYSCLTPEGETTKEWSKTNLLRACPRKRAFHANRPCPGVYANNPACARGGEAKMALSKPNMETKQDFGEAVPDFSLALLDGSGMRTLQDYLAENKGAVIVFWSAVCAHCRHYDAYFNSFRLLHPQLGFVAIASRYGEKREQMEAAVKKRRLLFPVLWDESGGTARRWHSQQTPRCYLLTGEGRLAYRGAVDNFKFPADNEHIAYLEPAIASYLAGESIVRPETASFGCAIETLYYHLPRQL